MGGDVIGPQEVAEGFTCADLGCVDVEVGMIHHPYCGWTEAEIEAAEPPLSPEDEETLPRDPMVEDPCICDRNPDTTEGTDIECPVHGA